MTLMNKENQKLFEKIWRKLTTRKFVPAGAHVMNCALSTYLHDLEFIEQQQERERVQAELRKKMGVQAKKINLSLNQQISLFDMYRSLGYSKLKSIKAVADVQNYMQEHQDFALEMGCK